MAKAKATKKDRAPQKALPGMEKIRIAELDDICETIGKAREQINSGKAKEAAQRPAAIRALHRHNKATWTYQNVVISLAAGEETLAIRVLKAKKRKEDEK